MRALVVYESMFGNTAKVAESIAEGIAPFGGVSVVDVTEAPLVLPEGIDLLVVGGPTHALGLSRRRTREAAVQQGGRPASVTTGVRDWMEQLTVAGPAPAAASFDTRMKRPRLPGSAARRITRSLRSAGLTIVRPPQSFWVEATAGPLVDAELDRAKTWGADLATTTSSTQPGTDAAKGLSRTAGDRDAAQLGSLIAIGAGLGSVVGLVVAGGPGIAGGLAFGALLGVMAGVIGQGARRA